jgi:hypothetical protein
MFLRIVVDNHFYQQVWDKDGQIITEYECGKYSISGLCLMQKIFTITIGKIFEFSRVFFP